MATRVVPTCRDYEALPSDGRPCEWHEGEVTLPPLEDPVVDPASVWP